MSNLQEAQENPAEARKAELLRRLREADAKIDLHQKELDTAREQRELEERVRHKENAARDLPHIREAEEKHGDIRAINTPLGAIVLRKPNHLAFQKFTRWVNSGHQIDDDAIWRLVKPCIVYPDITRVEEIVEEYPATTVRLGEKAMELAKGKAAELEGK